MFELLTERLEGIFRRLRGRGVLTPEIVKESLRDVRRALLEADVHFTVARRLVSMVEERAVGQEVLRSLQPGAQVVKIVHEVLTEMLGGQAAQLPEGRKVPRRILLVGLQGSGKTTTAAKLGAWLRKARRVPVLAACDLQRPAAVEQLQVLGRQLDLRVYAEPESRDPVAVARSALAWAREQGADDLILDTAGRLQIDEPLMEEVAAIRREVEADAVVLVVDGMTGQEAVSVAEAFHQRLGLDGVILTKMDGDARGGAALSVRAVTGVPILFLGVGEKTQALEVFHPQRLASRILGMGDILSLVEKAQAAVDREEARRLQERLRREEFTLEDFLEQIRQVRKMGPLEELLQMIPGLGGKALKGMQVDPRELVRVEAMIRSMTPEERQRPEIIDGSRRRRIARGSGTRVQDVNRLLRDFEAMRRMVRQLKKGGRMRGLRFPGLG
jgi:signal recognition particle subunit SRP54